MLPPLDRATRALSGGTESCRGDMRATCCRKFLEPGRASAKRMVVAVREAVCRFDNVAMVVFMRSGDRFEGLAGYSSSSPSRSVGVLSASSNMSKPNGARSSPGNRCGDTALNTLPSESIARDCGALRLCSSRVLSSISRKARMAANSARVSSTLRDSDLDWAECRITDNTAPTSITEIQTISDSLALTSQPVQLHGGSPITARGPQQDERSTNSSVDTFTAIVMRVMRGVPTAPQKQHSFGRQLPEAKRVRHGLRINNNNNTTITQTQREKQHLCFVQHSKVLPFVEVLHDVSFVIIRDHPHCLRKTRQRHQCCWLFVEPLSVTMPPTTTTRRRGGDDDDDDSN